MPFSDRFQCRQWNKDVVALNRRKTQFEGKRTGSCSAVENLKKKSTVQRTIFTMLIQSTSLNHPFKKNPTFRRVCIFLVAEMLPHASGLFQFKMGHIWTKWVDTMMEIGTPNEKEAVDALLRKNLRVIGQKTSQVGVFVFNTLLFFLRIVCWILIIKQRQ